MAKKFKINASDGSIKRYSDVVPQEKRRYWYFTTHGIGPGMLPSDVKILETKEGQNKKGTWGDFICLDSVLNTDELKAYDLIELAPDMVESACGSKKAVKSATRKPLRKRAVKASFSDVLKNSKEKYNADFKQGPYAAAMNDGTFGERLDGSSPKGMGIVFRKDENGKIYPTGTEETYDFAKKLVDKFNKEWHDDMADAVWDIQHGDDVNSACGKKKPVKSSTKRRAVKASDVDADRPNSAPNSWKSSQRMAYKVTEDQTKGERTFPTSIDDVYKVLGEMQGTWTNPTTGWTGECEIYERDLDDGSYIFSLIFGGNELEPDDILYVPGGFDYYSNKPKFTIYPHSGAPTFADSLEDFKRKLKKEYSYLRKVDDVKASADWKFDEDFREFDDDFPNDESSKPDPKDLAELRNKLAKKEQFVRGLDFSTDTIMDCMKSYEDWLMNNYPFDFDLYSSKSLRDKYLDVLGFASDEQLEVINKGEWQGIVRQIRNYRKTVGASVKRKPTKKVVKASAIAKYKAAQAVKAGINAPSTDGPLCVCENCKAEIESREGRQTVYNVISDLDIEPDEKLICDWCEDEATELYQISPDDVEGAKKAVKCSYDDVWEYQESYENNYDDEIPADELDRLNRRGDLTEKYELMWFEKWGELHPNERYSSIDSYPDVDEAVGFTLDEAQYSPEKIKASTKAIKANDGIAPDDYDSVDDMVSYDDNMFGSRGQYNSEADPDINNIVYQYINDNYNVYISNVDYVEYTDYNNWVVDCFQGADAVESDFVWFVENNNTELYNKLFYSNESISDPDMAEISSKYADTYAADDAIRGNDFFISFYALKNYNGQYSAPQIDLDESELIRIGFTHEDFLTLSKLVSDYEAYCINTYQDINDTIVNCLESISTDEVPIESSTDVNADLQLNKNASDRKKYNWGKNPITDIDGYVKDIADGVVERFPNLTYEISDEAITFTNNDSGEVVYIQSIDEIVPEKEDLENDTEELSNAIQHEQEEADWYNQNSDAVEMSTSDDELEPIMGDGFGEDDMGYGFDSNGEVITESVVEELYRIAEQDVLQHSKLAEIDEYVSIDEDSWKFYMSSPSVSVDFYIHFKITEKDIDFNSYVLPEANTVPDFNYYTADLDFDIYTMNGEITDVVLEEVKIYRPDGAYDEYDVAKFDTTFNKEAIINYVEHLAGDTVSDIYNAVTNL